MLRVLVVDDHRLMRDGLCALLGRERDLVVAGEAADGFEAVAVAGALCPDVVLMDVCMPGLDGVEATRRIIEARPETLVLGVSGHTDRAYVDGMRDAGASGYVLKSAASTELVRAIHDARAARCHAGGGEVDHRERARYLLSIREREVLRLLAEGSSSKDVATRLGLAVSTVETHRRHIMTKLDLHSVAELTKYAIRHGITSVG